ncbi:MAG: hypothetical protein B7733_17880 [Myxococcales bacterium FL481]|nr:MAG: hypothetical protein B7733_17880 [Myxococcales bacterium FL481]
MKSRFSSQFEEDGASWSRFDVEFYGCTIGNVTMDGDLGFSLTVSDTSSSTTTIGFAYEGHVVWSGGVDGSCDFDLRGDSTGRMSGQICGQSARDVGL